MSWTAARSADLAVDLFNKALRDIRIAIDHHEQFGRAYFWNPAGNASGRRRNEERNSFSMEIVWMGDTYAYESKVTESCKHVYYTGRFWLNGERKDVRLFRRLEVTLWALVPRIEQAA